MLIGNKSEVLHEIGDAMKARRLRRNISQLEAAERSGISIATIRNFEKGRGISLWGFVSLCRTYGHDAWIEGLVPQDISDYANQIKPVKFRERAARRKEVGHV